MWRFLMGAGVEAIDSDTAPHQWLDARALRAASDVALGVVVTIAGLVALWDGRGAAFRLRWSENAGFLPGPGFFPTIIGGLLLVVGIVLLVRGGRLGRPPLARWRLRDLAIVAAVVAAVDGVGWRWGSDLADLALRFGPAEIAALAALKLTVAIALAHRSRARAIAMVLLGLLVAMVGIDASTGELRLTMGLEPLTDGVDLLVVALGLLAVADAGICLISPPLFLATYTRLVTGSARPAIATWAAVALRIASTPVIGAAWVVAFSLNAAARDVGFMLVVGAFGVACKVFG